MFTYDNCVVCVDLICVRDILTHFLWTDREPNVVKEIRECRVAEKLAELHFERLI